MAARTSLDTNLDTGVVIHEVDGTESADIPRYFKLTNDQTRALNNLSSDATHNALGGGSRSGKTFLFVRSILIRALKALPDEIWRYR